MTNHNIDAVVVFGRTTDENIFYLPSNNIKFPDTIFVTVVLTNLLLFSKITKKKIQGTCGEIGNN